MVAGFFQFCGEEFFVGEEHLVFAGEDFAAEVFEGVSGDGFVFFGAEDETDGRVFTFVGPVFAGVVEVEVHLSGIGVGKLAEFQVDDDEAAQAPVEEEQVYPIPFAADAQAALATDEGEIAAEFHEEGFEMADEGVFEVCFRVFVPEVEELEDEGVADFRVGDSEIRNGVAEISGRGKR